MARALKVQPPPPWTDRVEVYLDRARVVLSIIESVAKHLAGAVGEIRTTLKPLPPVD
tara:strand:+ start:2991 stop:3161 length:171 start_codon:yes stop_codon:yes gene_type:complete